MGAESYQPDRDALNIALRKLDAAKALMHKRQAELSDAIPNDLQAADSRAVAMNEASELYRLAVGDFNVACQKDGGTAIGRSEPMGWLRWKQFGEGPVQQNSFPSFNGVYMSLDDGIYHSADDA